MKAAHLAFAVLLALPLTAADAPKESSEAASMRSDVTVLASDRMEGRGLGTKGIELAADWIEKRLKSVGLQPAFGKSYRQQFPVKTGVAAGEKNELANLGHDDWTPLAFSSSGDIQAPIAFVGYGIEAEPLGYNDFDGIDLHGKVAMMLRYEPQERDDNSKFDGRKPSRWSAMRYKVLKARERGAVAVVFATGPMQDEGKDKLPQLVNDGPESPAGIPVIQVKTTVAQRWLSAYGIDLAKWQADVDADLKPRSKMLAAKDKGTAPLLIGHVDVNATYADTVNLAGVIPGRGKLAAEVVVLGAHYDHLGWGGQGSMKPNVHEIHNGADDNASGTVAVLHVADRLAKELKDAKDRRTVYVTLFSAEERGLGGSGYMVAHPPFGIANVVAMVNLDMVGQMKDGKLIVYGTDSAAEWPGVVERAATQTKLSVTSKGDGYGPSDQTSFYAAKIPVLHLFTGAHDRYHTPDDDADSLNYEGMARSADFTLDVMRELANGSVKTQYVRATSTPMMEGDSRGYGSYLGTVPDYASMEASTGGVKLADVRAGGPADKAGIKGGDTIVEMAGTKIENIQDMTYALQDHKPGDTIDVIVLRGGERMKLRATLGSRKAEAAPGSGTHGAAAPEMIIKAGKPFEQAFKGEKHFKDVRQLTFGGENAEAYFSPDGKKLIFQSTPERGGCDQQFVMNLETGDTTRVSSGNGRTTCGYFAYPKGDRILYASTEAAGKECPPPADRKRGYIWGVYPTYDIFVANPDGSNAKRLTSSRGYDAEATWCHQGGKIVFTSDRDGDLELYTMDENGDGVKRITNAPGYDGGAFFSPDCRQLVWRASRPTGADLTDYQQLLAEGWVRPSKMELFIGNADGSAQRQLTSNGAANFCPFFTIDGKRIIFSSNMLDQKGHEFDIFMMNADGSGTPERITTAPAFDGFPMFSPDGKWLVWGSNRANPQGHDTNLFIARWVD